MAVRSTSVTIQDFGTFDFLTLNADGPAKRFTITYAMRLTGRRAPNEDDEKLIREGFASMDRFVQGSVHFRHHTRVGHTVKVTFNNAGISESVDKRLRDNTVADALAQLDSHVQNELLKRVQGAAPAPQRVSRRHLTEVPRVEDLFSHRA